MGISTVARDAHYLRKKYQDPLYWAMKNCDEDPDKLRALIENIADHYQVFHIPGYYFSPKGLTSIIRIQIYECFDLFPVVLLTNYTSNVICFSSNVHSYSDLILGLNLCRELFCAINLAFILLSLHHNYFILNKNVGCDTCMCD